MLLPVSNPSTGPAFIIFAFTVTTERVHALPPAAGAAEPDLIALGQHLGGMPSLDSAFRDPDEVHAPEDFSDHVGRLTNWYCNRDVIQCSWHIIFSGHNNSFEIREVG
jgi:hypothetical protein